ncbi:MAG: RNA-guided endonuclease InsQ/TnpB family protein [Candidatus Hodarchaeota archaeon]
MYRTQINQLRGLSKEENWAIRQLSRPSKNLYNVTLWTTRQYWEETNKFLPFVEAYHLVKENENYKQFPSQMAQQTMKEVERVFKSFFGLLKRRQQRNYNRAIHSPRYLPKDGFFTCIFQKDMLKVERARLRISLGRFFAKTYQMRYLWFFIPPHIQGYQIKEVRFTPRCGGRYFQMEWIYELTPAPQELKPGEYLAIDLSLDNFATCVSTTGAPFILDGRGLKSFNRWWNKRAARLQSIYVKQQIKIGAQKAQLLQKRADYLRNFMGQTVNTLITYCLQEGISHIVLGELKGIKQHASLGKQTNQNFHHITYGLFKQKLRAKCEYYGIKYLEVNEAYTFQTCASCGVIRVANRKHRGLYVCHSCGSILNADVNGALNILAQVSPESSQRIRSSGRVNRPTRIRVVSDHTSRKAPSVKAE